MAQQKFYRTRGVDDMGLAFRRFFSTNFLLHCPACGQGKVTKNLFELKDQCEHCTSRYERLEGNFLVSSSLNFFITALLTLGIGIMLVLRYGFFSGLTPLMVGIMLLSILLLFRPMRVLALYLLWLFGFVYPDRIPRENFQAASS